MRTTLENTVLAAILDSRILVAGDRVGVAVSGGADSVALLRLLENLRAELGITLLVVHFDHCLRGAESKTDAEFVSVLARSGGLEFVLGREDVASVARDQASLFDRGPQTRDGTWRKPRDGCVTGFLTEW
jgi:tRNA(Ile)-lysidine synthase